MGCADVGLGGVVVEARVHQQLLQPMMAGHAAVLAPVGVAHDHVADRRWRTRPRAPPRAPGEAAARGAAARALSPAKSPTCPSDVTVPANPPPDSRRASWTSAPMSRRMSSPGTPASSSASTARSASVVLSYALQSAFMGLQCGAGGETVTPCPWPPGQGVTVSPPAHTEGPMNALCRAYDNTTDADRAVQALLDAGVPGDDIRLLHGPPRSTTPAASPAAGSPAPSRPTSTSETSPATAIRAAPRAAASPGARQRTARACSPTPIATWS